MLLYMIGSLLIHLHVCVCVCVRELINPAVKWELEPRYSMREIC